MYQVISANENFTVFFAKVLSLISIYFYYYISSNTKFEYGHMKYFGESFETQAEFSFFVKVIIILVLMVELGPEKFWCCTKIEDSFRKNKRIDFQFYQHNFQINRSVSKKLLKMFYFSMF